MNSPMFRLALWLWLLAPLAVAADIPGAADPIGLPRVAGSEIIGYRSVPYDAGPFVVADDRSRPLATAVEGAHIRVAYLAAQNSSPLMIQKNYAEALAGLGSVEEIYQCKTRCVKHVFATTLWTKDNLLELPNYPQALYLLGFAHNFDQATYRYVTVTAGAKTYHVGVFAAVLAGTNANASIRNRTVTVLDVVETKAFESTLEFVDAAEMTQQLNTTGAVALYGIQFDHDKATLKDESAATVEEIATLLKETPALKLYVVGHTDDVGTLTYNQDLSLRRAKIVVERLIALGIDVARLTPIGVGPVAPNASNASEDGRALNRRVEIVARQQ
ncbi:MAG: OmpA family protein [Pseudomonadota bacterium]